MNTESININQFYIASNKTGQYVVYKAPNGCIARLIKLITEFFKLRYYGDNISKAPVLGKPLRFSIFFRDKPEIIKKIKSLAETARLILNSRNNRTTL